MKRNTGYAVIAALLFLLLSPVSARENADARVLQTTFRVIGQIEKPGEWSAQRISRDLVAGVKSVSYNLNGEPGKAQCVSLLSLVQYCKPRVDAKIRNAQLGFVVVVHASDGYTAAFSMGELLPTVGKRDVWLAFDFPDGPISDKDGPAQLIVPEDDKPSRWVHGITSIAIVDCSQIGVDKK